MLNRNFLPPQHTHTRRRRNPAHTHLGIATTRFPSLVNLCIRCFDVGGLKPPSEFISASPPGPDLWLTQEIQKTIPLSEEEWARTNQIHVWAPDWTQLWRHLIVWSQVRAELNDAFHLIIQLLQFVLVHSTTYVTDKCNYQNFISVIYLLVLFIWLPSDQLVYKVN